MISLAMDDLHPQLSSNVQKFITGIHRELDHRLSGYMHGIERHLDSKINEKVNSLTKSLEQKMDDLLAKHRMETREMMKEIFGDEVKEVLRNDEKDGGSAKEDKRDNETETPVSNQANQDFQDPTYPELSPEVPLVPATGGDGSSLEIDTSRQPAEVVHVSGPNEVDQPSSPSTSKIPDAPQNTVPSPAIEPDQFIVSIDVDMPLAESANASTTDEHGSHQIRNEVSGKCIFYTVEADLSGNDITDHAEPVPNLLVNPERTDGEEIMNPDASEVDLQSTAQNDDMDADPQSDEDADADGEHDTVADYGEKMVQD
ncbi:hypothetical protein QCA50_011928 [Cerrena zonata]|uniref:Uncharacterized protein n=1 Tax=Cerrena zonata TaxID=2478898 RepID=A0AAW0FW12_9APHY